MKNSGIGWVGEIPENWKVEKMKYHLQKKKIIPFRHADEYERMSLTKKGIVYRDKEEAGGLQPKDFNSYQLVNVNDLVFRLIDLQNVNKGRRVALAKHKGLMSAAYTVLTSKTINNEFLEYFYLMMDNQRLFNILGSCGVRSSLTADELMENNLCFPDKITQMKIVDFLDRTCSEIDTLSADIQSQIDVLEEYKKSVITEAVTKGLNPDVEMKDSGIEWVGIIPAHWEVHPVYRYFGERKIKNSALKEQNLLSLSYGKIVRKDIESLGGLLPASFNTYNIVEAGDIIIRPTDLQNDKRSLRTGLVTEHGIITSAYIDLMPKVGVNSKYFHYLLHSYDVMKVFYNMGNGVRQGLNYSEFAKLMIFAPSIQEQQEIANYLDKKCAEIEAVIAGKKAQLETLAEYKKSLIYEYVTGKKEVPNGEF